jgi:hypothetical protein
LTTSDGETRIADVALVGGQRYDIAGPFPEAGRPASQLIDEVLPVERGEGEWRVAFSTDDQIPVHAPHFVGSGVLYARAHLFLERDEEVGIRLPATCPTKLWVDGELLQTVRSYEPLRPNCGGDLRLKLSAGWHTVQMKFAQDGGAPPFEAYLRLFNPHDLDATNTTVIRQRAPH